MKRRMYDERNYVVTEVMGKEREETKQRMSRFFVWLMHHADDGSGFPKWGETRAKLMEVAYVLTKWQVFTNDKGLPMSNAEVAEGLCKAVHCPVPCNIYQAASRCRRKHRRSVVDYYAKLWRENKTGPERSLLWTNPVIFPKFTSYRGVFA